MVQIQSKNYYYQLTTVDYYRLLVLCQAKEYFY